MQVSVQPSGTFPAVVPEYPVMVVVAAELSSCYHLSPWQARADFFGNMDAQRKRCVVGYQDQTAF